jgi:hypothetical protein
MTEKNTEKTVAYLKVFPEMSEETEENHKNLIRNSDVRAEN